MKFDRIGDGEVALDAIKLTPINVRYLCAYLDLMGEKNAFSQASTDIQKVGELIEIRQFREILMNPLYQNYDLKSLLTKVLDMAEVSDITKKFILVLLINGRLSSLPQIVTHFPRELAKRQNVPIVEIVSAQILSKVQLEKLTSQFEKQFASNIFLEVSEDPKLIAGIVVKVGSQMLDTSLKSKLNRVQSYMKGIG